MRTLKKLTITLALLLTAVTGAWADEEPQLLTKIYASSSFLTGSQTFDDIATVTFGGAGTIAFNNGWIQNEYEKEATVTVTAVDGYTITSIKIYAADSHNATISTSPFTAYLNKYGATYVTTGSNYGGDYVGDELAKIEVYGYKSAPAEPTEWSLTPDETGKTWTLDKMPANNIELQVEYYAESNLFLSKNALADKTNIAVTAGDLGVQFGNDGKSANTITEGTEMTVKYNGTKKVIGFKVEKKAKAPSLNITSPVVGQVIGSDGKNYAAASVPSGVTKVAMIAYVSGSNGLAIALADEGELNWATAKSTCEAKTPAFTNGTWHLPSQAEWNNMFSANGGDEESYTGLNTTINNAGGTILQSGSYWSSSEYSPGVGAHFVHLDDGDVDWSKSNEALSRKVRACLAF